MPHLITIACRSCGSRNHQIRQTISYQRCPKSHEGIWRRLRCKSCGSFTVTHESPDGKISIEPRFPSRKDVMPV